MYRTGQNPEDMQRFNRSLVLRILSKRVTCTRSEIAESTELAPASITKIISSMIEAGIVHEGAPTTGKMGRRSISISLNRDICKLIAVKIARKSFDVAVFRFGGEMVEQYSQKIDVLQGADYAMAQIKQAAERFVKKYPDVRAMGVAVPGPYMRNLGRIAIMSEFSGWDKVDIRDEFANAFNMPVSIEHDANASALAEWQFGGPDIDEGLMVSFLASEGIGAGAIDSGQLLLGVNGVAGEVGHMSINVDGPKCVCGNCGCLELYCSALSFARWVRDDLRNHPESSLNNEQDITAEVIFEHMRRGDAFAIAEVKKVGAYVGYGMANLVYLYNPHEIVMTDIMTGGGELLLDAARETVRSRTLPILSENLTIRATTLEHDSILMGAAALAMESLLDDPAQLYQFNSNGQ